MSRNGKVDLFPSIITSDVIQDTINTFKQVQINLPVPRMCETSGGKSWVTEICKVQFVWGNNSSFESTTKVNFSWSAQLSTTSQGAASAFDPTTFLSERNIVSGMINGAGSGGVSSIDNAKIHDMGCQDKGFLVATDRIFFLIDSAGFTANQQLNCVAKIWYRLVPVGIKEYVGIVQGQQGNA